MRYNSISSNTIKTYNRILEQTTFREYSDNFKKIYNYVNKWPDGSYQKYNSHFENKSIKSIFEIIQKDNSRIIEKLNANNP